MSDAPKKTVRTLAASFHGVAAYDPLSAKAAAADYKTVAAGMSRERLDKFFFPDMQKYVLDPIKQEDQQAISLLEGKHWSGFRISIVAAQSGGTRVFMPMIDDTQRGQTLLVGPGPLQGRIAEGVTYVDATHADAQYNINTFLADGARKRGEDGTLRVHQVTGLVEDMIKAVSGAAQVMSDSPGTVPESTTVGDVLVPIALGKSEVAVYSVAAQQPRKFKL